MKLTRRRIKRKSTTFVKRRKSRRGRRKLRGGAAVHPSLPTTSGDAATYIISGDDVFTHILSGNLKNQWFSAREEQADAHKAFWEAVDKGANLKNVYTHKLKNDTYYNVRAHAGNSMGGRLTEIQDRSYPNKWRLITDLSLLVGEWKEPRD